MNSKTLTEITFSPKIQVTVDGGGGRLRGQTAQNVGTQIADQTIKVIKQAVTTN